MLVEPIGAAVADGPPIAAELDLVEPRFDDAIPEPIALPEPIPFDEVTVLPFDDVIALAVPEFIAELYGAEGAAADELGAITGDAALAAGPKGVVVGPLKWIGARPLNIWGVKT